MTEVTRTASEKRQRTERIQVRVTPAERAEIQRRARQEKISTPTFVRISALGGGGFIRRDAAKLVGALGRIGNNLNQLARRANEGNFPAAAELQAELDQLRPIVDALTDARRQR